MGSQQQGPVFPQPIGMPGWFQPPGQADPVQRLALMMALMVLGMPPVHCCYAPTRCGVSSSVDMSEPRICPPTGPETRIGIPVPKLEIDEKQWAKKDTRDTLRGQAVIVNLHVRVGRSDAEGQVREVQTALRSATHGILESP